MALLLARKLAVIALLLPCLNLLGFWLASTVLPATIHVEYNVLSGETAESFLPVYRSYVAGLLRGDLGTTGRDPVARVIATPLRNSLLLLGVSFMVVLLLGPLLGVASVSPVTQRRSPRAQLLMTVGAAVPGFFFGSLVIATVIYLARASWWPGGVLLPVQGYGMDAHLIVPVLTLAIRPCLYVAGITAGLLEGELTLDYGRVALSKGVSRRGLIWRHAIPNIAAPMLTSLGQATRMLVSGLILVEALFDWKGLGWLLLSVIALDDRNQPGRFFLEPAVLALLLVAFGAVLLLADLVFSVVTRLADPRLRADGGTPA